MAVLVQLREERGESLLRAYRSDACWQVECLAGRDRGFFRFACDEASVGES
jgi:hypothetical protein